MKICTADVLDACGLENGSQRYRPVSSQTPGSKISANDSERTSNKWTETSFHEGRLKTLVHRPDFSSEDCASKYLNFGGVQIHNCLENGPPVCIAACSLKVLC